MDMAVTIGGKKFIAHRLIDEAAGRTRLKYITETPGQQAVYLLKLEQARAFLANPESTPGPYISMEAEALGMTPLALANEVILNAAQWGDVLGPAIEATRRGYKKAVTDAATIEEVEQVLAQAIAALAAL